MKNPDLLAREVEDLRSRLSLVSKASLRINESLDLDAELQGALDSARSLTGARYGVIIMLDEAGRIQDFLSSGMTGEEASRLWETPDQMRIFEQLGSLTEPLRIPDLLRLLRQLGFPGFEMPVPAEGAMSFMAAPDIHLGERLANLFVGGRATGPEFTLVIVNARRYREEQRARHDLQTLIDASPIGVMVFDGRTRVPVSFNQEARRIVDPLRDPGQHPEQLLNVITVRRADGLKTPSGELSLREAFGSAEVARAEEIALKVPDGRCANVLLNATPIRFEDGWVNPSSPPVRIWRP